MTMIEVVLSKIVIRETNEQQVIFLKEKDGERSFPIIIGVSEAIEINRKITDVKTPRPMTHDLVRNVMRSLDAHLKFVVVDALKDATFYAKLHVGHDSKEVKIDARPSDAVAIAVAEKVPIFVDDSVFDELAKHAE